MAKAKKVAPNTKEKDTREFFEALALMGQEKGIPLDYLVERIKTAIALAVKKDPAGSEESIVEIDPETMRFYVAMRKEVVEELEDPLTQITLEDAVKYDGKARIGEIVEIPLEPKKFGRIAAQSAKHVIRQGIREAEKGLLFQEFRSRQHDIVTATVLRVDPKREIVTLEIGNSEAVLPKSEQVPGEELTDGQKIRVYVVDAQNGEKGPRLMISRTHPSLVKRLFEMQVPEIYDGVVEIKAISREAGSRSKLAVMSRDENVDPVGACIGPKGALAILSVLDADSLRFAIMSGDVKAISRAPGIGPRTAERLILELKDKIRIDDTLIDKEIESLRGKGGEAAGSSQKKEAVEALVSLGYGQAEAAKAVSAIEGIEAMDSGDVLKAALKNLF